MDSHRGGATFITVMSETGDRSTKEEAAGAWRTRDMQGPHQEQRRGIQWWKMTLGSGKKNDPNNDTPNVEENYSKGARKGLELEEGAPFDFLNAKFARIIIGGYVMFREIPNVPKQWKIPPKLEKADRNAESNEREADGHADCHGHGEFLKYYGTFFSLAALGLTQGQ
ncbi:unnamed protein product [Ranitomeya imitator]|uniref:Uncharacterized protein n=1 Tax=Ranitomeya imitator TaxID=111125 RepID=A0ABN9M4T3_9NEOB|nr:unnamed protein product [Ranitomeya imitator]